MFTLLSGFLDEADLGIISQQNSSQTTTTKTKTRQKIFNESEILLSSSESEATMLAKEMIRQRKEQRLNKLLEESDGDLITRTADLKSFAHSEGGLINDEIRSKVWPILADTFSECFNEESSFSSSNSNVDAFMDEPSNKELKLHPEWDQVEMDVNRTLARFPHGTSEYVKTSLQSELIPLIVRVLSENKKFRYYQGFHDVCLTLILVLGTETAFRVARILAHRTIFKKYLTKSLEESAMHDLQYMYVLLFKHNPRLEMYLREAELGTLFALSWPLTWFSYALNDYKQVVMCFDLFLSSDSLMSIYVSAAMVHCRQAEIYATKREMVSIHQLLCDIPNSINISLIFEIAQNLYHKFPPKLLVKELFDEYKQKCKEFKKRLH